MQADQLGCGLRSEIGPASRGSPLDLDVLALDKSAFTQGLSEGLELLGRDRSARLQNREHSDLPDLVGGLRTGFKRCGERATCESAQ